MELKYFIIRRALVIIPTLMGLTILTFLLLWAYGPNLVAAGFESEKYHNVAAALAAQGFNFSDPIGTYFSYLAHLFTGNWGTINQPISAKTLTAVEIFFPNTIQLAIAATIVSVIIAIPLGTYIGARPNSPADQAGRIFSLSGYALPAFWLAYVLIILFGKKVGVVPYLNIFPYDGNGSLNVSSPIFNNFHVSTPTHILLIDALIAGDIPLFESAFMHLILPVATLTYGILAGILRFIRAGMVDASNQEFVKTARAKGVPEKTVIKKHIRKNALLPTVTVLGLLVSSLLGGVVTVEYVFDYLGIGYLAVYTAEATQVWGILVLTFIFGIILMITNLIVDVIYAFLDPRIRY
ncbi:MAG: ABC transporter permease [Candidatus Thermoplasmatota archaeon]|nr:ABC transporter permease [Candidatus Thermoplasmatota archaeon]MCL5730713.1 ABC transporter permease [Candidatus Thermoplasmatota archaeon]